MKSLALLILLILTPTLAADTLLVVNSTGKPYLLDTNTGDRTPVLCDAVYVDKAYGGGGGGNTPGTPDDPGGGGNNPDVPDATGLRSKVKSWAEEANDTAGARIFNAMFDVLGERIASGEIPADSTSVDEALTNAVKVAVEHFPRGSDPDDWKKVKSKIQTEVSRIAISNGGTLTKKEWVNLFADIENGFADSYSGEAIPIWLAPILNALIEALIAMLRNLF